MSDSTELATTPIAGEIVEVLPNDLATRVLWADMEDEITDLDSYSKAESTILGYCSDWSVFAEWCASKEVEIPTCDENGRVALTPETVPVPVVKMYIVDNQDRLKHATISRHISAIKHFHTEALDPLGEGIPSPTDHPAITKVMAGLRRKHAYQPKQAGAIRLHDLLPAIPTGEGAKDTRDRALLAWGFYSTMRRSELVLMRLEDLTWVDEGARITIPKSKTDQEGKGRTFGIWHDHTTDCQTVDGCETHICPVCNLRAWVELAGIKAGEIWRGVDRHGNVKAKAIGAPAVSEILKARLSEAGVNASKYSAHSLRAGGISSYRQHGAPVETVREISGHRTDQMVSLYTRLDDMFKGAAGTFMVSQS